MPTKTRVEVDFRGLCMFVPSKDDGGNSVLHVLMPKTDPMGTTPDTPETPGMAADPAWPNASATRVLAKPGKPAKAGKSPKPTMSRMPAKTAMHAPAGTPRTMGSDGSMSASAEAMIEHVPRVVFSLDYEASENPSMAVVGGFVTAVERVIDLTDCPIIDWSDAGTATTAPVVLPPEIVNVSGLAEEDLGEGDSGAVVKTALLKHETLPSDGNCAARITLPGTVTITPYNVRKLEFGPDGAASPGSRSLDVAACTLCVFETSHSTLNLPLPGAHNLAESGGVIRVMFANMVPGDYQHPPLFFDPKGKTHFGAFYTLLNTRPTAPQVPKAPPVGLGPGSTSCMTASGSDGGH